jgi:hypothetical protein
MRGERLKGGVIKVVLIWNAANGDFEISTAGLVYSISAGHNTHK